MTVWYFSDSIGVDAAGYGLTPEMPFKTLLYAYIAQSEGDTLRFKAGDTWRETFYTNVPGVTVEPYGEGSPPIFSGGELKTGWTFFDDGWWYLVSPSCGVVTEDGYPLTFLEWDTDFFTTTANSKEGSYCYWPGANILYVKCSDSGDPNTKTIEAAERDYCAHITHDDFSISGINTEYGGFVNFLIENCKNTTVDSMSCNLAGGRFVTELGVYIGNGLQMGDGSKSVTVNNVSFDHIFDTAISPQTYNDNAVIDNININNITAKRCGYAGLEIAVTGSTANSTIKNVEAKSLNISASGFGFSGIRYGNKGTGIHIETPELVDNSFLENIKINKAVVKGSANYGLFCFERVGRVSVTDSTIINNKVGIVSGALSQKNKGGLFLAKNDIIQNVEQGLLFSNADGLGAVLKRNIISGNGYQGKNNVEFIETNRFAKNLNSRNKYVSQSKNSAFFSTETINENEHEDNIYYQAGSFDPVSIFGTSYNESTQEKFKSDSGDLDAKIENQNPIRLHREMPKS